MRIAFTGVLHWHIPLYLDPALATPELEVVGVADPDMKVAERVAAQAKCPAWSDWRAMLDQARPEFVFVLGRHCDMAEVARELMARGIPFAVEKPAGIDVAEVRALKEMADRTGAFAAIPFVLRESKMMEAIAEFAPGEAVEYLSFKFVGGSVDRYRTTGCDWMLDRRTAGGGCMLNLGVHFFDLARVLFGCEPTVAGAMMSNARDGLDTEDHGLVLLRAGNGGCLIETGYIYPAPHMTFDMHFSIRTENHYFAAKDSSGLEILTADQKQLVRQMPMTNPPYYPHFVRDVCARAASGRRPVADLSDMLATMILLESAYAMAPLPAGKKG